MCIEDNRCFLVSLCLEQLWERVPLLLRSGWGPNAQFKVGGGGVGAGGGSLRRGLK